MLTDAPPTMTKDEVLAKLAEKFPRRKRGSWFLSWLPDSNPELSCWYCEYRVARKRQAHSYTPHDNSITPW